MNRESGSPGSAAQRIVAEAVGTVAAAQAAEFDQRPDADGERHHPEHQAVAGRHLANAVETPGPR